MPSLVARDLSSRDVRRIWPLDVGTTYPLGREVPRDQLLTDWDQGIAPRQAVVRWQDDCLHVDRASEAPAGQPIFYAGSACDSFQLIPGEGFVIGRTIFRLDPGAGRAVTPPTQFFQADQLQALEFHPTQEQLGAIRDLLMHLESDRVNLDAFLVALAETLKRVVRSAQYVAILDVGLKNSKTRRVDPDEECVRVRTQSNEGPGICEELVVEVCNAQNPAITSWKHKSKEYDYPPIPGVGWAYCAPVIASNEAQGDLAIYLSGAMSTRPRRHQPDLSEDERLFIGIVAWILNGVRTIHGLKRYQTSMQEFFPKPIRNLIYQRGPEDVFRTEQARAAVLFCDLRGSCKFAEQGSAALPQSWDRLEIALSVMTESIANQSGTIGDFQGDAAMGFWGWPDMRRASSTDESSSGAYGNLIEAVSLACKAAEQLREKIRKKARPGGELQGFACGIGIAAGEVVAGMLGTEDQRKIGVFGPVVNLAARLESMTKQFGTSILIDPETNKLLSNASGDLKDRTRSLGKVLPLGLSQEIEIFELMPPHADPERLSHKQLRLFEYGLKQFKEGDWAGAQNSLNQNQLANDGPSKFLLNYIALHRSPPADWKGVIQMTQK
jgi:adenylate cyclase